VLNSLNRPLAAVMLSLPSEAYVGDVRPRLAELILSIASRLSRRMGADLPAEDEAPVSTSSVK
jgi:DNA-binding IclR family transcriptional regulator